MGTKFNDILDSVAKNKYDLERQEEPTIRGYIQAVN